ncbi:DMT family transporter [Congregibacter brevis]|uniref:DMT family transporter n=1 Tax=Congregibacter brevis TaxID=3081201 RepID=A0ABZ0IHV8_9GAMM|nr:DMT family transporter [Congregibacter sp. IMCC45268]
MRTTVYTTLALIAFAGNSILCRLALGEEAIDPSGFTIIRLLSAVAALLIILSVTPSQSAPGSKGSWSAASMLFVYAAAFSYAYTTLETGIGALILFTAVQLTMIASGLVTGERPNRLEWLGLIIAFSGFAYLVAPGAAAPPLVGLLLMSTAGIAWGFYTLLGRRSEDPLRDTSYNFLRTLPLVLILLAATVTQLEVSIKGVMLAVLSGSLASGVGYSIWYAALRGLSGTQAAVLQLCVPVIASLGGIVFAQESLSLRLVLASAMICGGILSVILGKANAVPRHQSIQTES